MNITENGTTEPQFFDKGIYYVSFAKDSTFDEAKVSVELGFSSEGPFDTLFDDSGALSITEPKNFEMRIPAGYIRFKTEDAGTPDITVHVAKSG